MSSNYQQKKMMNALGAIDTKGNIVLEQFQDGTALLFQPGNAQPFCVATDYDRATASWSCVIGHTLARLCLLNPRRVSFLKSLDINISTLFVCHRFLAFRSSCFKNRLQ